MKKTIILLIITILAVSMIVFIIAGCKTQSGAETTAAETTAAETTAAEEGKPISINMWTISGAENNWFQEMTKKYSEEHPNITFNITVQESQNLKDITASALSGGAEDIDLLWFWGNTDGFNLAENGLLLDLTSYFDSRGWGEQQYPAAKSSLVALDGKNYFLSTDFVAYPFMYYNKKILKEANAEVPNTLNDIFVMSEKIKSAGYDAWSVGNKDKWTIRQIGEYLSFRYFTPEKYEILRNWKNLSNDDKKNNLELFRGEEMLNIFKFLEKMAKEGVFIEDANVLGDNDALARFTESKAAIYSSGSWAVGALREGVKDFEWDYFLMPEFENRTTCPANFANAICVPAKISEEKLPAVLEFMDTTLKKEYAILSFNSGLITSSLNLTADDIAQVADPTLSKLISDINNFGGELTFWSNWPLDIALLSDDVTAEVVAGTMTPEEAVEALYNLASEGIK